MGIFTTWITLYAVAVIAQETASTTCEAYSRVTVDNYGVTNWIEEPWAPDGQQCVTIDGHDGTSVSWHSNFSWSEPRDWLISAPYATPQNFEMRPLGDHVSLPTTWEWSFDEGIDIKAAACYFIHGDRNGLPLSSWIVSIWLRNVGNLLPSDNQGSTGEFIGTATLSGITFDIHRIIGSSGSVRTFLFAAQEDQTSFSGDLVEFLEYANENHGAGLDRIRGVQAGADVYGGKDAVFTTKKYSLKQVLV